MFSPNSWEYDDRHVKSTIYSANAPRISWYVSITLKLIVQPNDLVIALNEGDDPNIELAEEITNKSIELVKLVKGE